MGLDAVSRCRDYAFPVGTCDVREWEVRTLVDDTRVGVVHDVLLDGGGVCRYLDIDLGLFDKHVLLPVGQARADAGRRLVWVPGLAAAQMDMLPAYAHEPGALTRADEQGLLAVYTSALARESHAPRPAWAGTVYGPSELEDRVTVRAPSRWMALAERPDLAVAEGEPDPRGWPVHHAAGRRIGAVEELIVDTEAMKVRHLVCRLDGEEADGEARRLLIPVGFARLEPQRHLVHVAGLSPGSLARLPEYGGEALEEGVERALIERYRAEIDEEAFYDQPHFDPGELFGAGGPWPDEGEDET